MAGLFSAMWAVAALVGPLLGAVFVATIGWRWIFEINVPVGFVSAVLLWRHREPQRPATREGHIDFLGAVTLTAGIGLLLWGLGAGSPSAQPNWPVVILAVALLLACVAVELRAQTPLLPVDLLRSPLIGPATLAAILGGTVLFAGTAYVPLYVQGGLGRTPFEAGAAVALMSVGWPVASLVGGRILLRVGFRRLTATGTLMLVIAGLMLAIGPAAWGVAWVGAACFVCGLGLGSVMTPLLTVVQSAVPWERRGTVTALQQFARSIGGSVGVSLMGLIVAGRLKQLAGTSQELVASSMHSVFLVVLGVTVATLLVGLYILLRTPDLPDGER